MCKHELKWNSFGPSSIYCSLCPNFISSFTSDYSCFYCNYHECNTCYKNTHLEIPLSFIEKKKILEEYKDRNVIYSPRSVAWPQKKSIHEKFYNASRDGKLYSVRHYLNVGANKNTIMPNGYTALMIASERGHLDIVQHLLSIKVNIDIKNKQGKCAILLATDKKILFEFL
jgi:ankyrin repeat protein